MKKFFLAALALAFLATAGVAANLYLTQEKRIFDFPKVASDHQYQWSFPHREIMHTTPNNGKIHTVLFETEDPNPKGVIFYCHGKGSNLGHKKWINVIDKYTGMGFDFYMIDYRGAGKSRGDFNETDMLNDCHIAYQYLLDYYPEESITVYGKSLGTSFATYTASRNNPRTLILEAPFYNLFDVGCSTLPNVPPFIIKMIMKYPLKTNEWLEEVTCPVYIIHGTADKIIPHSSSIRLKEVVAKTTNLVDLTIIEGGDHDHLYIHDIFGEKMAEALGAPYETPEKKAS